MGLRQGLYVTPGDAFHKSNSIKSGDTLPVTFFGEAAKPGSQGGINISRWSGRFPRISQGLPTAACLLGASPVHFEAFFGADVLLGLHTAEQTRS